MRHSLDRIKSKPTDYTVCIAEGDKGCGDILWYELEECPFCGGEKFRPATQEDVNDFAEDYAEAYPEMDFAEIFVDFG